MPPLATPRRLAGLGRWLGLVVAVTALALPATAQRTVTLRMNSATLPDTLKPSQALAGAQLRGCLDGAACVDNQSSLPGGQIIAWNANTTLLPQNVGGDNWQVQFQIPDNSLLNFKFYFDQSDRSVANGGSGLGGWEDGDNLQIPAGTGPVTLDLHYFNKTGGNQPYDWRPFAAGGDSIAVWFRVYMRTQVAVANGYTRDDPALRVSLRGNFGERNAVGAGGTIADWSSTPGAPAALLTRESGVVTRPGYDLYSGLVRYPPSSAGQTQTYKFFFEDTDTNTDSRSYETTSNRSFTIPAAGRDTTLFYQYFSNSPVASGAPLVQSEVSFRVDVRPLSDAGVFQVADDQLQIRGPFNDWGGACTDNCIMTQLPQSVTYAAQFPITAQANSPVPYKYFVNFTPPLADPNNGYEEPLDFGGGDRSFVFQGASGGQTLGTQFFNDIRASNVVATGRTVNVGFEVDMRPALTFPTAAGSRPFNPATDQVTIFFQDPIWKISQGYNPVNDTPVPGFVLTDPDGDGIYTGSLPVRGPTYNGIGYQVAFGNPNDLPYITEGAGGTAPGRRRYRYITSQTATSFQFARDVIRPKTQALPWEINPTGAFTPGQIPNSQPNGFVDTAVANEGGPGRAGALQISALFPNPTTGLARMTVRTGEGEALTVRVYDVMGRLVVTAAENVRTTGEQTVQIDTQGLAAGLYVVRAESGTAVATRRLTVIR